MDEKILIAKRVAQEIEDGNIVNLGIGLPMLVVEYLPKGIDVLFHSENGLLGIGPAPLPGLENKSLTNSGGDFTTAIPGSAIIDSLDSFSIVRGGHLDITVIGGLQVDEAGQVASWNIPGKMIFGMGGAMDLTVGAKKVIVAMTHTVKGIAKILKKCTFPLTSTRKIDLVITDMAVIEPTEEGLLLKEIAPNTTVEEVVKVTEAHLIIASKVPKMNIYE